MERTYIAIDLKSYYASVECILELSESATNEVLDEYGFGEKHENGEMNQPKLSSVEPMNGFRLKLTYENNEIKVFDVTPSSSWLS